jgi:hypothetical protein
VREQHQDKKRKSREKHREVARTKLAEAVSRRDIKEVSDANHSNTRMTRNAKSPQRNKRTRR